MKALEKNVRTAIKQDLSQDLDPPDYVIWGVLENKTNAISHLNIGSLKTAVEEKWNTKSKESILKACKLFWKCVNTIIGKKVAILSTFTVLCLLILLFFFLN